MAGFIVVLGMVGAGKSLQSQELARRHKWSWVSTGELLRASTDPVIKDALSTGELLDDQVIFTVLEAHLITVSSADFVILDGFPRRLSQVAWLDAYGLQHTRLVKSVLHLNINPLVAAERLAQRARADDTPEGIAQRNAEYNHEIKPVIIHYRHAGLVSEVNTDKPANEVAKVIDGVLAEKGIL